MNVNFQIDYKDAVQALTGRSRRQVPFLAAKTLTGIAQDVTAHLKAKLPQAFDRPTPFTQRGVFMKAAEKNRLTAEVYFPDSQEQQGKATREYIRPGTEGAVARQQKKTEYLLTRMGYLPAGWVTVPGRYIMASKLDGYGNMPGSYYKQIIRALRIKNTRGPAKPVSAASARRAARMGVDAEFFAVSPGANKLARGGGWLPPGVYKRTGPGGRNLVQYLKFVRKASYKQRLDIEAEAKQVIQASANKRFAESVNFVLGQNGAR